MKTAMAVAAALALTACAGEETPKGPTDITIAGEKVFPESITADAAGNLYVGSMSGTIYRATPGSATAEPWVTADEENGLLTLLGVLADDERGTLWVCSAPPFAGPPSPDAVTSLKALDLATGKLKGNYPLPASGTPISCNDMAIDTDGTVFVTESVSGGIYTLAPDAEALKTFAKGPDMAGLDGIAFAEDGTLYANNIRSNEMLRVERNEDGSFASLFTLFLTTEVDGPDGLRPVGGNRFLQAEGGAGRVRLLDVDGNFVSVRPIIDGLDSSTGVTRVGDIGYATQGKIRYMIDPELAGQDPGTFVIRAFSLPEGT